MVSTNVLFPIAFPCRKLSNWVPSMRQIELLGTTTPGQSGPERKGNERVLHIPQSSNTGAIPSDGNSLGVGFYPSAVMQSAYSTSPANWGKCHLYNICFIFLKANANDISRGKFDLIEFLKKWIKLIKANVTREQINIVCSRNKCSYHCVKFMTIVFNRCCIRVRLVLHVTSSLLVDNDIGPQINGCISQFDVYINHGCISYQPWTISAYFLFAIVCKPNDYLQFISFLLLLIYVLISRPYLVTQNHLSK